MAKNETLLEKAKKLKTRPITKVTEEEIEVAVAWAKDELSTAQVQFVYNQKGSGIYGKLAIALKIYIQKNG